MTEDLYSKILCLVCDSPYHQNWGLKNIEEHIDLPISLNKFVLGMNDDDSLFFFATFAFPKEEHIEQYLRTNQFPIEGYYATGEDIWIIDFICLGGMRDITVAFRCLKNLLCSMGYSQCFWLRTEKRKLGFHIVKE